MFYSMTMFPTVACLTGAVLCHSIISKLADKLANVVVGGKIIRIDVENDIDLAVKEQD